jgi:vitamin B12 transporter
MFPAGFQRFLFCAVAVLLSSALCRADRLIVTVTDPQSALIEGARIIVSPTGSTRVAAEVQTSSSGTAILELAAGSYVVQVVRAGFVPATASVEVKGDLPVTVKLQIAPAYDQVAVTAERTPLPAEASTSPTAVLDEKELVILHPVSAADALEALPGAVLAATGQRGALISLFVRGGESRFNKVLVDGVPVNQEDSFFNFGVVPMIAIDRIELVRGPDSALYGADAMTSVVRLETAPGHTRLPELIFGGDGGNFSTAHGFAKFGGAHGHFDYKFFADQFNTAGQGANNDYSNSAEGSNIGIAFTPRVRLRVRGRHLNSRSGVSGEWKFNNAALLPPDTDQFARQNDLLGGADLEVDAPERWQHHLRGFAYSHRFFNQDSVPERGCDFVAVFVDCPFKTQNVFNRAGGEYQGEFDARTWSRTLFGYSFEDEHADLRDLLFGGETTGLRRNHDVSLEQIVTFTRATFSGGVRYVHNPSFGNRVVPRIGGSWTVARGSGFWARTRLHAGFSQGIRAPDFLESFGNPGFFILPNRNLKAEENDSWEAGVHQAFAGGWSLSGTYFHNSFRNLIDFKSLPNFEAIFVNLNKSLAHGAEFEIEGHIRRVRARGGYFYTSTQVVEAPLNPFVVGTALLRRPRHSGLAEVLYSAARWGAGATGTLVGRRPDSDFLGFGIDHAAGYARADLSGWYAVNHHITAYANIGNAFNVHYNQVVGYPALGANFRAGLQFRVGGE